MSDIPDTNDVRIATIAAALSLASRPMNENAGNSFQDRMKRFLEAYRQIIAAVYESDPSSAEKIMAAQK